MKHYICTGGCKGVSEVPGTCQMESCPLYTHPLTECDCANGLHNDFKPQIQTEEQKESS